MADTALKMIIHTDSKYHRKTTHGTLNQISFWYYYGSKIKRECDMYRDILSEGKRLLGRIELNCFELK